MQVLKHNTQAQIEQPENHSTINNLPTSRQKLTMIWVEEIHQGKSILVAKWIVS